MIITNNFTALIFLIIVPIIVILLLLLSVLFSPINSDNEKSSQYDCGMISINDARSPFPIALYLVAILFLVLDVELVLLYPISITLSHVDVIGFWVSIAFLIVLTVGFVFELASGSLNLTN